MTPEQLSEIRRLAEEIRSNAPKSMLGLLSPAWIKSRKAGAYTKAAAGLHARMTTPTVLALLDALEEAQRENIELRDKLTVEVYGAVHAEDDIADLRAEVERLRSMALKAFTVVEYCAGEGFMLEAPYYDPDDLLLEMAYDLDVEDSFTARRMLKEANHGQD